MIINDAAEINKSEDIIPVFIVIQLFALFIIINYLLFVDLKLIIFAVILDERVPL